MSSLPMRFVPAPSYYAELLEQLPKAKKRIVLHAMNVMWDAETERFIPLLLAAAKRGVSVRIVGDIYTKYWANQPKIFRRSTTRWKKLNDINQQLAAEGIYITYVGKLGLNLFKNRCHSKITIIDDQIYTFGGVNINSDAYHNRDYMLAMHDRALADYLAGLVDRIATNRPEPFDDIRHDISDTATLLFDGGTPGQSVIYQTACNIVSTARKVYYVSQMCPSGTLAGKLNATESYCYFVRPLQVEPPSNLALMLDKRRYHITNLYKGKAYIHAKYILTEDKDGSRHLLSGSNNFSWRGVAYGTKEIAVHSTDPQLWQIFYDFLEQQIIADPKSLPG